MESERAVPYNNNPESRTRTDRKLWSCVYLLPFVFTHYNSFYFLMLVLRVLQQFLMQMRMMMYILRQINNFCSFYDIIIYRMTVLQSVVS